MQFWCSDVQRHPQKRITPPPTQAVTAPHVAAYDGNPPSRYKAENIVALVTIAMPAKKMPKPLPFDTPKRSAVAWIARSNAGASAMASDSRSGRAKFCSAHRPA